MTTTESATARTQDHDGKLAQGVDKATAGAHQKIDHAKDAAQPTVDHIVKGAHSAVDAMGNMATHTAEALELKGDQFNETKDEFISATQKYLREHPVASIGIAVAAGFLLSRILGR